MARGVSSHSKRGEDVSGSLRGAGTATLPTRPHSLRAALRRRHTRHTCLVATLTLTLTDGATLAILAWSVAAWSVRVRVSVTCLVRGGVVC